MGVRGGTHLENLQHILERANKNERGKKYANYRERNARGKESDPEGRDLQYTWGRCRKCRNKSFGRAWDLVRLPEGEIPTGEVSIDRRSAYDTKRMPLKAGHTRTASYLDEERRLDGRFARKAPPPPM